MPKLRRMFSFRIRAFRLGDDRDRCAVKRCNTADDRRIIAIQSITMVTVILYSECTVGGPDVSEHAAVNLDISSIKDPPQEVNQQVRTEPVRRIHRITVIEVLVPPSVSTAEPSALTPYWENMYCP